MATAILARLRDLLDSAVKREDDVGAVADLQLRPDVDADRLEAGDFVEQRGRINHHAVADNSLNTRAQNAAGDQLQYEFLAADEDGMAGIVAALIASHGIKLFREQVDDFALAFVAPLRSENYQITHVFTGRAQTCRLYRSDAKRLLNHGVDAPGPA